MNEDLDATALTLQVLGRCPDPAEEALLRAALAAAEHPCCDAADRRRLDRTLRGIARTRTAPRWRDTSLAAFALAATVGLSSPAGAMIRRSLTAAVASAALHAPSACWTLAGLAAALISVSTCFVVGRPLRLADVENGVG